MSTSDRKPLIKAIAAMDEQRVIGKDNAMPWHIPGDMENFRKLTWGQSVLMGRKTYESIPERFRPFPGRENLVVSRKWSQKDVPKEVKILSDPLQFIQDVKKDSSLIEGEDLWVIGGQKIYELTMHLWDELFVTRVAGEHEGDAFFPEFEDSFQRLAVDERDGYSFERYGKSGL